MSKWVKRFAVELYDEDGVEINSFVLDTKSEQLERYYHLINSGYKKSQIEKFTIDRLED